MIELKGIHKKLGTFSLRNISFGVEEGTYFVLLGASGSGKSVMLEMMMGLHRPDAGSIWFKDRDITHESIQSRGIGLVYQDQSLFPHMSVRQNISYPLKHQRLTKPDIEAEVNSLAEKVGIDHLLDRRASTLSIGEAQRTALARTLATRPKLLLLDEPLASLDVQAKSNMRSLLRRLNNEGLTIIHVTHDYQEAISLASRLAVLENGTVAQIGTPTEIFDHPKSEFIARFTGVQNFYKGSIKQVSPNLSVFTTGQLKLDIATDAPDGSGYALLRAQDITLSNQMPTSSLRNHFQGTVTDIEPVRLGVEITVNIGIAVTAVITHESMKTLDLELDGPVWVNFKATAVRFLEEQT